MNHADFGLGTWYPKGGFNAVALGMVKLLKELGIEFHVNEEVIGIDYEKIIKPKKSELKTEFMKQIFSFLEQTMYTPKNC